MHVNDLLFSGTLVSEEDDLGTWKKTQAWRMGRRVVELGLLADALDGCKYCGVPLRLSNCSQETRYGLSSILHIECDNLSCLLVNMIQTGSHHRTSVSRGMPAFDVNTKAAAGQ